MIYILDGDDIQSSMKFTSKLFATKEPTSVSLRITSKEFERAFRNVMEQSIASGYSYKYESKRGKAVILNIPYDQFVDIEYDVFDKIEPMFALFDAMNYKPSGKCLYVFSIASDACGLANDLLKHTIDEARKHDFKCIVADCTNVKSQMLFEKHGFVVRSEITYDGFEQNIYSFKNICGTKSIQKMELIL